MLHKNVTHTLKQTKQRIEIGSPQEDIINDDSTAEVSSVSRVTRSVQSNPFALKNPHHTGIKRRRIARPKWHDAPTPLGVIGSEERQFFLVREANSDLMVPGLVVQQDEVQTTSRVAEVIDGIFATWHGVLEGQGDLIETMMGDAHAPNKLINIHDVFLVRLGGKNDRRAPRPEALSDPTIGFEDFKLGHDYLTLMRPVVRLLAADWGRGASVDGEFKI